jgi:hypothetical protein
MSSIARRARALPTMAQGLVSLIAGGFTSVSLHERTLFMKEKTAGTGKRFPDIPI